MKSVLRIASALLLAGCAAAAPARTDGLFAAVHSGMTQDEVRRIAGAPDEVMPFPLSHSTSFGYYYWDQFGYYCLWSATFGPDGRVASTFLRRLNDGGDHGM
jgi:hypothetical protein